MQLLTNETFADATKSWIVLVDFFAERCGPCKMIAPYLDQLATQYEGKVSFYKVDVDQQPFLSQSQGIRAMPTFKIFQNGSNAETVVWADLQKIMDALVRLTAADTATTTQI